MERRIIQIDEERCNGCGLCEQACEEGAIGMVNGKARLLRDDYCDGLGNCLPACPQDAIHFIIRDVAPFDEAAVKRHQQMTGPRTARSGGGCPGQTARALRAPSRGTGRAARAESRLRQWPVQIQLVPANAPYLDGADLLVAADCAAYANGNFHEDFMKDRITLIGCPKLDDADYRKKLTEILRNNDIRTMTVVRMEVPCCGGLEAAASQAVDASGKNIPLEVVTIATDGTVKSHEKQS